jgi:hypothetical protein
MINTIPYAVLVGQLLFGQRRGEGLGRYTPKKYFENNMSDIYRGKNDVYYYFIANIS